MITYSHALDGPHSPTAPPRVRHRPSKAAFRGAVSFRGTMKDLLGKKVGRLTVIGKGKKDTRGRRRCLVICDCGTKKHVDPGNLRKRTTQSCGCLRRELLISNGTKHGHAIPGKVTPAYKAWRGINERCEKETYRHYHGRGIRVCKRWHRETKNAFINFLSDMGERPRGKFSIDRRNNDGNYTPANCRWADAETQQRNRRTNTRLTFNGESKCIAEWSQITGLSWETIHYRIRAGWTIKKALTQPSRGYNVRA